MANYASGPNLADAVYKNVWKRSTEDIRYETHVCAASTIDDVTLGDDTVVKVLQPGTVMALITSGGEQDRVGPFDDDATDGRQLTANIVGINDTYLPVQLNRRDVEVAIAYANVVAIQDWCLEYDAGAEQAMAQATADAIEARTDLDIIFRPVHPDLV